MNVADSETIMSTLVPLGYSRTLRPQEADVVVINTCSIRQKAEHKLRSLLGRMILHKNKHPTMKLVVAGCVAKRAAEALARSIPQIDILLGPDQITHLPVLLEEHQREGKTIISTSFDHEDLLFELDHRSYMSKTTGFVPIMKGCDHKCTYCIVPFTRGTEKSRPIGSITAEVTFLVQQKGLKEITLVGQNVNGYGRGTSVGFAELLSHLSLVSGLKRLRFMTSHPKDCTTELAMCFRDIPQVMPYLHLPVQSGSNRILRRMKRGHTHEWYRKQIDMFRTATPKIAFSTDIIVGFPGETAQDFQDTMQLVQDIGFDFVYSFAYSPRPGTPAARLDDTVPDAEKKSRLHELQHMIKTLSIQKSQAEVGNTHTILVSKLTLKDGHLDAEGTTPNFKKVRVPLPPTVHLLDEVDVRIIGHQESMLLGERIGACPL